MSVMQQLAAMNQALASLPQRLAQALAAAQAAQSQTATPPQQQSRQSKQAQPPTRSHWHRGNNSRATMWQAMQSQRRHGRGQKPPPLPKPPPRPRLPPRLLYKGKGKDQQLDFMRFMAPRSGEADPLGAGLNLMGSAMPFIGNIPGIGPAVRRIYSTLNNVRGVMRAIQNFQDEIGETADQAAKHPLNKKIEPPKKPWQWSAIKPPRRRRKPRVKIPTGNPAHPEFVGPPVPPSGNGQGPQPGAAGTPSGPQVPPSSGAPQAGIPAWISDPNYPPPDAPAPGRVEIPAWIPDTSHPPPPVKQPEPWYLTDEEYADSPPRPGPGGAAPAAPAGPRVPSAPPGGAAAPVPVATATAGVAVPPAPNGETLDVAAAGTGEGRTLDELLESSRSIEDAIKDMNDALKALRPATGSQAPSQHPAGRGSGGASGPDMQALNAMQKALGPSRPSGSGQDFSAEKMGAMMKGLEALAAAGS